MINKRGSGLSNEKQRSCLNSVGDSKRIIEEGIRFPVLKMQESGCFLARQQVQSSTRYNYYFKHKLFQNNKKKLE